MAPLPDYFAHSSSQSASMFPNASRAPPSRLHDVEIIEIDDDSDENDVVGEEEENSEGDEEQSEDLEEEEEQVDEDEEDFDEDEQEDDEYSEDANGTSSVEEQSPEVEESGQEVVSISSGPTSPGLLTSNDLQNILHPLRHTVQRVTTQIETFANNLESFKAKSLRPNDAQTFLEACDLIKKYRETAANTVKELSTTNNAKKAKQPGAGTNRENGTQPSSPKLDEQIRRWQLEAETWDLFYQILSVNDPESRARAKRAAKTALQCLHRYSTDREVWDKFLEVDHFALECVVVLKWLEKTSRDFAQDLDALISELEMKAERGQGLWAHGWLYTKEAIKGAKRLRSWPQPLDPDDPGITISLLSSEQKEPLITQLDPDAVTRQRHGLQKQDQFYEQATWLTCWKMLRQGESWSKIRAWSEEHLENWRAISLCGSVGVSSTQAGGFADDGISRMMSYKSQESWRSACSALANNPGSGAFERAVYALLCGETEPAYAVCRGWGDHLYVYLNHMILSRYREFCKQLSRKMSYSPSNEMGLVLEPPAYASVHAFLDGMHKNDRIREEARNPYRTIQAAIVCQNYDSFFYHQANAVSKVSARSSVQSLVPKTALAQVGDASIIAATDKDSLRIIAHLFLTLLCLGGLRSDSHYIDITSANVISYIEQLQNAGRTEFIPVYASLLPENVAQTVLGRVLIDVVDPIEREQRVKSMKRHNINLTAVLDSQWQWVLAQASAKEDTTTPIRLKRSVVRQPNGPGRIGPVKRGLVGNRIAPEDERLVRSVDWRRYETSPWPKICSQGALLYKRFFASGRLAAARQLYTRVKISEVPLESLGFNLTTQDEDMTDAAQNGIEAPSSPKKAGRSRSPIKTALHNGEKPASEQDKTERDAMYVDYQIMRDLEQLIAAFDALETWAIRLDEYEHIKDPQQIKDFRKALQSALDKVTECVEPLCGEWLEEFNNEAEKTELQFIRTTYIPEIILAYHSTLYFAGHTVGREILTHCMTLATVVAGSDDLMASFMASQRMCELMDAFALSSMALMNARDVKMKKKLEQGATIDIWKIKSSQKGE